MIRISLLLIIILYTSCRTDNKNIVDETVHHCSEYPVQISSLDIKDLYDSARWYIYTWQGEEIYLPKVDTGRHISFGELPLKFTDVKIKGDTIEINFNFSDHNKPILPSSTRDYKELSTSVAFELKSRRRLYMLSSSGFSTTMMGGINRYENPLQPEVVSYMKFNWNKIDECFRMLAKSKGFNY